MKKLLKNKICESINSTHDVHWLAEKSLKSPTLQLLFIEQCMNSNRKSKKRVEKKNLEKRRRKHFSRIQT